MCAKISPGKKRQPIDGFPTGWYVYFESPTEDDVGMRIVTPVSSYLSFTSVAVWNVFGFKNRFLTNVS